MRIEWDEHNLRHLLVDNAHRGIEPWEVMEVLKSSRSRARRRGNDRITGRRRREFLGRTASGRLLCVVVEVLGPDAVRPITAWEP